MSFLDSPQVKRSLDEALFLRNRLQEQTQIILLTGGEDVEIATEYLHTLYALVDKEHGLYTRFRLSSDTEALIAASELDGAKVAAKSPEFKNADAFYRALKEDVKRAISKISGEDLDEPVDC